MSERTQFCFVIDFPERDEIRRPVRHVFKRWLGEYTETECGLTLEPRRQTQMPVCMPVAAGLKLIGDDPDMCPACATSETVRR